MRSEQALKNMMANIGLQLIVFLSGIILPRFYLEAYGSSVNGMITSVGQFLSYLGLAEAGVGTASLVALYGPLANEKHDEVNSILSATKRFYNKSGVIFLTLTMGLSVVYPLLISKQLDAGMVRGMIVVLAASILIDYFFVGKYKVFLTANQKGYVVVSIQAVGTILNTVITIIMIQQGFQVVLVKLVATGVYVLRFFVLRYYVKKKYPNVRFDAKPNYSALHQRGAALLHQVVGIIVNNTDVVVLTIFLGRGSLLEVSVYGIYNMVVYAINMLLTSFSNGLTAGFGEVISKGEEDVLVRSFSNYEYMYMIILFVVSTCMWVLLLPFVAVYTQNMKDVNYIRPIAGVLFTLIVFLQNVRTPGMTIIGAAGHFKETRKQAILEAVINIVVSMLLVWKFGMVGVLLGTACSYGYRSLDILIYNCKYLVKGTGKTTAKRIGRNVVLMIVLIALGGNLVPQVMSSFLSWFGYSLVFGGISFLLFVALNYICEPSEATLLVNRVWSIIRKKEK